MTGIRPCSRCGWREAGGRQGCRARFDLFLARSFSNALFAGCHRMFVDTYCLQHPEEFCASAKSLAAHLTGLCWILEGGASPASGPDRLHRWLNGECRLDKPPLPERRGAMNIGDFRMESGPEEWGEKVRQWAESTWAAYAELHPLARCWMAEAARG